MFEPLQKKIELLAPAGNMDALIAAVEAGCDAVYLGITNYSARAFAGNFTHEEFQQAVRYCHIRNVRVYVTMNTLLFEKEIDLAMREIDFLYNNDVDALLIQDFGLFHRVRKEYPDLEVHCSTQMHIHNPAGCQFMKEQGAARAVLARETPIEVIRECVQTGIEIEVFSYGALCVSYSGQCLMSEAIKNRSGNRGTCAQMCRLRFHASNGQVRCGSDRGEYALAMKDLNLIDHLPELIEAGVSSLKIEGRMKRKEYVYLVTKTFREAIDACYVGKPYQVSPARTKELELLFHRGFTKGHAFHDDQSHRMTSFRPNHMGVEIGRVVSFRNGRVTVALFDDLHQHDGLRILNDPIDTGLTAVRIEKNGKLVNMATAGDTVILDCHSKPFPKPGQPLLKTSDTALLEELDRRIEANTRTVPVTVRYEATVGKTLTVTAMDPRGITVTSASSAPLDAARKAPLSHERIAEALSKTAGEPYEITVESNTPEAVFLPVSMLNEVRRSLLEQLSQQRAVLHKRLGHQPYDFQLKSKELTFPKVLIDDTCHLYSKNERTEEFVEKLPVVSETDCAKIYTSRMIVSEPGNLWHTLDHCIAGMTLNATNSYACAFLLSIPGMEAVILSSECNNSQINDLLEAFKQRYGFVCPAYQLVYGRRDLMVIKDYHAEGAYLEDLQKRLYPVIEEGLTTRILEPEPTVRANEHCMGSYIILTTEDRNQSEAIKEEAYEEISGRI